MPKLIELCEKINMGQSPDSSSYNDVADGIPFFQGNADFGKLHPITRVWCNEPKKIAQPEDILISVRAPIGALNIADQECCIGRGLAAITVDTSVCNRMYLWFALQSKVDELNSKGTGSTFKAITRAALYETEIAVPSLEQQSAIADKLLLIEEGIEYCSTIIEKLDLSIKARFSELFLSGRFPSKRIENVCAYIVDCPHTTPKYEGNLKNPAIRTSEIKKGYIAWETMRYVSDEEYEVRVARLRPEPGDIVYGREGTFGNAAILPSGHKFCLGQRVMLLRPDYSQCTSEYLLYAVISDDVYRQAKEKNNASTVPHVNVKDVKNFTVPLPSIDVQKEFADFVTQTTQAKDVVRAIQDKLYTLKASFMQEYFG